MEEALADYLLADTALAVLIGERLTWVSLPQGVMLPAAVLTVVSEVPICSDEGETGLTEYRVQIDCWGETYAKVKTLARAFRARLSGAAFTSSEIEFRGAFLEGAQDLTERVQTSGQGVSERYRVSMDFQVWSFTGD